MRIAFHAPLKPPDNPVPSGDRQIARLLIAALRHAGHQVDVASQLRTREPAGNSQTQADLLDMGKQEVARLLALYKTAPPDLWFTYHLYYKAPDLIGPSVCRALGIPYVVAEASHAGKRMQGPWAIFAETALQAIIQAGAVIALNRADMDGLGGLVVPERLHHLHPFIRGRVRPGRRKHAAGPVRLLAIGMMRGGDKLQSYRALARAVRGLRASDWHLTIVGGGPMSRRIRAAFQPVRERVTWTGTMPPSHLGRIIADHDLMVWPAVNEAFGMALVEACCHGLPIVAGRVGGVPDVVAHAETGILVPPENDHALRQAIASMIRNPQQRQRLGSAAWRRASRLHGFDGATRRIDRIIRNVTGASCGS
ncbi:MAG: glycosyltransferase family 4 protein [Minwuia sp.]|nr:glycosyltransferase family 4 protein [Minwuia sp.]